jgi:hypothetical protein
LSGSQIAFARTLKKGHQPMQMLRGSGTPWRRHATIGLVIAGLGLTGSPAMAGPAGAVPLAPGLGCGVQDGAQPAVRTVLHPRLVRAERAKPRRSPRVVPSAPAPVPEAELPAVVLHAFYACAALPMPVKSGWIAVGPLRRA